MDRTDKVTREHIQVAAARWVRQPEGFPVREKWWAVVDGRSFPVQGLLRQAYLEATGETLGSESFTVGSQYHDANQVLKRRKFYVYAHSHRAWFSPIFHEHVLMAIRDLDTGREHDWGEPIIYHLLYAGRRYAPKPTVALAYEHATGEVLKKLSGGNEHGQANYILRQLGFEVVEKNSRRYWLTTHWPAPKGQSDPIKSWRNIWLKEGKQAKGQEIRPGDRVLIYEMAKGRNFTRETADGTEQRFLAGNGQQGIVSVGEVTSRLNPDGLPKPDVYGDGSVKWWRWRATTGHHNDDGFVRREEVVKVIGGNPTLRGLGGGSGLLELAREQYDQLLSLFKSRAEPKPPTMSPTPGYGGGGESPEHLALKKFVAHHPERALKETGLRLVEDGKEYTFCTGDRIDVLLEDREGRPVAVEIELAQTARQLDGFLQAIKYRALICAYWGRPIDGGRAVLVAHDLAPEIMQRCMDHGVEPHIIPLSEMDSA